ncbi:hypothetical protein ACWD0Z_35235 [Streptomyces sp. NPDC003007]
MIGETFGGVMTVAQCLGAGLPKTDRALSIHPESRSSRLASNL